MYMIMFVLDDADQLEHVLEAVGRGGMRGATIVESTGIHRLRRKHPPMRRPLPTQCAGGRRPFYAGSLIVETEQQVQDCLRATEQIVGDLHQPHSGVFVAAALQPW